MRVMTWPPRMSAEMVRHSHLGGLLLFSHVRNPARCGAMTECLTRTCAHVAGLAMQPLASGLLSAVESQERLQHTSHSSDKEVVICSFI